MRINSLKKNMYGTLRIVIKSQALLSALMFSPMALTARLSQATRRASYAVALYCMAHEAVN